MYNVIGFKSRATLYLGHPNKMFRFPSPRLLWWWVGGSSKKKKRMNTLRDLGSFNKPGDAEPKDFVSVDLAENVGTAVNALGTKQSLKNFVSMFIKDKDKHHTNCC